MGQGSLSDNALSKEERIKCWINKLSSSYACSSSFVRQFISTQETIYNTSHSTLCLLSQLILRSTLEGRPFVIEKGQEVDNQIGQHPAIFQSPHS